MIIINIGDYETIQLVSIIYLLIYLIDIKYLHLSLHYKPMITNIRHFQTIQLVSIIYVLLN